MPISARIYLFVAIINDGDATYVLELTYHTCNHALRIEELNNRLLNGYMHDMRLGFQDKE